MLHLYPSAAFHLSTQMDQNLIPVDVNITVEQVKEACVGVGTNEKLLSEALAASRPENRFLVAHYYKKIFGVNLKDEVKGETSGAYRDLLKLLCTPLPDAEASLLKNATGFFTDDKKAIFPIVMGRTKGEIAILRQTFQKAYDEDLEAFFDSNLSGDFKDVMIAALKAAEKDADDGDEPGESIKEDLVNHVSVIMTGNADESVKGQVEEEFEDEAKDALLFSIQMAIEPTSALAGHFNTAIEEISTDSGSMLSHAIVRYFSVLPRVSEMYEEAYGKNLRESIDEATTADYHDLLLAIYDSAMQPVF